MAFKGKDTSPEKQTGFTFRGNQIILSKTRGRPMVTKHWKKGFYTENQMIEAATLYAVTGSIRRVNELTGIPEVTVRGWLRQDTFKRLLDEIRAENDFRIEATYNRIIERSAELVMERLETGDPHVLKDGTIIMKPVSLRDLNIGQAIAVDKREILRNRPREVEKEKVMKTVSEKLTELAQNFKKIANRKESPVLLDISDAEVISEQVNG